MSERSLSYLNIVQKLAIKNSGEVVKPLCILRLQHFSYILQRFNSEIKFLNEHSAIFSYFAMESTLWSVLSLIMASKIRAEALKILPILSSSDDT